MAKPDESGDMEYFLRHILKIPEVQSVETEDDPKEEEIFPNCSSREGGNES